MPDLINPIETYLKAILEMHESHLPQRRVGIASRLEQSGSTVTKTVRRMERDGLVSFSEESKKLALTPHGFRKAIAVMRKHRLAECFLDTIVGLDWALLHDEADRWEHAMSEDATDRVDSLLHHPERTPYGNPIPAWDAAKWDPIGDRPGISNLIRFLHPAGTERSARIEWFGESVQTSPQLLEQLRTAGVLPGARVVGSLHGPSALLHLEGDGRVLELPHQAAADVFVRP